MSYPCICLIACHIHGTMWRATLEYVKANRHYAVHHTMYMTCCKTYTWIRHDSVKGEYDTWFIFFIIFLFCHVTSQLSPRPPHCSNFLITHTHRHIYIPVRFLWVSNQLVAEAAADTAHNKYKRWTSMPLGGIWTCSSSSCAASDLHLRLHSH